jgi:type III secretory pathway component EscV
LDINTKCLEALVCYDFINIFTDEEEDMLLVAKPYLFTIGTIILPKPEVLVVVLIDVNIGIYAKIGTMQKSILMWKSI